MAAAFSLSSVAPRGIRSKVFTRFRFNLWSPTHGGSVAPSSLCRAMGHERMLWMRQERVWTKTTLPVVLYEEGDVRAREVAEHAVSPSRMQIAEGQS